MKTKKVLALLLATVLLAATCVVASAAPSMDSSLVKKAYYDWEYFNPQNLVVTDDGTSVTYSPDNTDFVFVPSLDELLTVETASVRVIYKNEDIGKISISVDHSYRDIESLGAQGHGRRCKGCGKVDIVEAHIPEYIVDDYGNPVLDADGNPQENWIPNDDGGLFVSQTTSSTCQICGAEMTKKIEESQGILTLFDFTTMTDTELEIVSWMFKILVTLIDSLVGF